MRKAHRPGPDPQASRSRSDSLVRMLELEKMCKMKRAQQDHGSSTSTRNPPRVSPPSTTANSTAPRPRRANDYPPLSHQTQIMKAVRRSVALPSLSLSVPPSPVQVMTMSSEGSVEELSLAKNERVRAVTFSEPEDEDLSDDSSICQSPSWEQYSQKKKKKPKKPKKGPGQKAAEEKDETAAKRRSNRLIKSAPIDLSSIKPLTTSDRSISAPELNASIHSSKMNSHSLTVEAQVALGKHPASRNEQGPTPKEKPKSRGFLSGFRLQHGNVAAVRELVAVRKSTEKGTEAGTDEDQPLRSIQYETIPVQQPTPVRPVLEQNITRSRKPPSIRSIISNSDHSLSSQERKNPGGHTPTGLGHGRSQSLLSSTLNKLRGPSYLYYQSSGDGSAHDPSKHTNSSQDFATMHDNPTDMSLGRAEKTPRGGAELTNLDHPQQPFDFAFPPKHKRVNTESGPEIAPRGRQPRSRKIESQSPNAGEDVPVLRPSGGRRVQIEVPPPSTRDTVMALVAAQERQSQTARIAQHNRPNIVGDGQALGSAESQQSAKKTFDEKHTVHRRQKGDVRRSRNAYAATENTSSMEKSTDREAKMALLSSRNERPNTGDGHDLDDDQISVDTHASTIRPVSRSHNFDSTESEKQGSISSSRSPARATAPKTVATKADPGLVSDRFVGDLITFEKDIPDTLPQPLEPHRDVDYFASFSDSYLPPVLDLRSPGIGQQLLPRFPFLGDSDEDTGHGLLHGDSQKDDIGQIPDRIEDQQNSAGTASSCLKDVGQAPAKKRPNNSPGVFAHHSDSDVSILEHPSSPLCATKAVTGAGMADASMSHSQHIDPSRTTSEGSSSSTCDDAPPSPSSATTPDSSRPQSRKGGVISQTEPTHITPLEPTLRSEGRTSRGHLRNVLNDISEGIASRGMEGNASIGGSSYSEAAMAISPEQLPTPTRGRAGVLGPNLSMNTTPTLVNFADPVMRGLSKEGGEGVDGHPARPLPPRTQSALDLHSTTKPMLQASRPQRLHLKPNGIASSVSLPSSPPADLTEEVMPRKSALKTSRNNGTNGPESSATISVGAAYLQEARKAAPVTTASASRALRPHFSQKHSSSSVTSVVSAGNRAEPLAKMLVECCNCHFFHDMPSRVYECMAKPDSVVEDKLLGVSAAITTMVRCPWCAHGMTTQCCSGYAAVVYLKEKLHGK